MILILQKPNEIGLWNYDEFRGMFRMVRKYWKNMLTHKSKKGNKSWRKRGYLESLKPVGDEEVLEEMISFKMVKDGKVKSYYNN